MKIIFFIVFFILSSIASLFGIGGGILYTPLQLWLGVPFKEAASLSLFLILITSLSSTLVFKNKDRVDWTLAIVLEIPTTLGAFLGGILSKSFSNPFLNTLLIAILSLAALIMIKPVKNINSPCTKQIKRKSKWLWNRNWDGEKYYLDLRCTFPIMFLVGSITSMIGISGGIFKVPIMVSLFKIPISIAVGSSAFMVGLTASAGFLGHASIGNVNWMNVLIFSVPTFIGAQIGSRLSVKIKANRLKKYYGYFIIVVIIFTIIKRF